MKIAIVGSRSYNNYPEFTESLYEIKEMENVTEIISGGAKGVDSMTKSFAFIAQIPFKEFPADWNKYGKQAGYLRNKQIVDYCDFVIAFWDGTSKGTNITINLARKANKNVQIILIKQ